MRVLVMLVALPLAACNATKEDSAAGTCQGYWIDCSRSQTVNCGHMEGVACPSMEYGCSDGAYYTREVPAPYCSDAGRADGPSASGDVSLIQSPDATTDSSD